jgi:hypothetical protein
MLVTVTPTLSSPESASRGVVPINGSKYGTATGV